MPSTPIDGKVALVLGASSGIGEEIARSLGREGCKLILAARRVDRCQKIIDELIAEGGKFQEGMGIQCDASVRKSVQSLYDEIIAKYGRIDIVVNTAGVMYFCMMKNGHWDDWEQTVDVNCKGTMFSCGAAVPHMISQKCGHIVNISSDAARQTFPALTVYNASKTFVHEFSKGLRCELVGTGVRVTELQPGDIRTDLIVNNKDKEAAEKVGVTIGKKIGGEDFNPSDESVRNFYLDPKDIADAVLYAVQAPGHVGVNEILIEPRDQMYGDPTSLNS
mmetsp:Transcript_26665/g.56133  ORF Transcript_26665/g.56133 Transcript_26665/m.56133 type:complete len:277 (+) Transcript_26665:63-893(+)